MDTYIAQPLEATKHILMDPCQGVQYGFAPTRTIIDFTIVKQFTK